MSEKNKGGRPPRPLANGDRPGAQSRGTYSVRLLNSMRAKLLADAEARGTSLSGQIEYIIQQWYDQPALIDALADRLEARRALKAEIGRALTIFEPMRKYLVPDPAKKRTLRAGVIASGSPVIINIEGRPDGGLTIYSDDVRGLVLSHSDPAAVLADVIPALETILDESKKLAG